MRLRTNAALVRLVACCLVGCASLGIWKAFADLPPICAPPPDIDDNGAGVAWFGYGTAAAFGFGLLLVVVIYVGKRWIIRFAPGAPARLFWYCLGLACSLPYIWFLVVVDWRNPFVYRLSCWVYDPIAVWAVPTVSFAWDAVRRTPCPAEVYLLRSAAEIGFFLPAWLALWAFVSFFFLGGGWI